jgi:predicted RNase H-like HicB family nuclease
MPDTLDVDAEDKHMQNNTKTERSKIWFGEIPDIFGYGISALGNSKKEVMDTLRKGYDEWKKSCPDEETNFRDSFENYGGYVRLVEIGKAYSDSLRE